MGREPTLSDLSANDNDFVDFDVALRHAARVRCVHVDGKVPASFKKLRRVIRLRLGGPLPKDLGPLRSVRELTLEGASSDAGSVSSCPARTSGMPSSWTSSWARGSISTRPIARA